MSLSSHRRTELLARPYILLLTKHEAALSCLYNCFGSTLPESKNFWRQLANEELEHRDIVIELEEKLETGEYQFAVPQFHHAAVEKSLDWIRTIRQRMEQEGLTMNTALKIALTIERGILESDFFDFLDVSNLEAKALCESLTKYTETHLKRIEDEAHKLKWNFVGNKVHFPNIAEAEWEPCVDPAIKIKAAQATILDGLISLEETASRMYNTYDDLLPDTDHFWGKLAAEEMQHAAMLRKLHETLEAGNIFYNLGQFDNNELATQIEFMTNKEFEARKYGITAQTALKYALAVEHFMAESSFYDIVDSDSEEYKIVAKRLRELTEKHISKLQVHLIQSLELSDNNSTSKPS